MANGFQDVKWATPYDESPQFQQVQQMFSAAFQQRKALQRKFEQEAYERSQEALKEQRAQEAHRWAVDQTKLQMEENKLKLKQLEHEAKTKDAEARLRAAEQTPMSQAPNADFSAQMAPEGMGADEQAYILPNTQVPQNSVDVPLSDGSSVKQPIMYKEQFDAENQRLAEEKALAGGATRNPDGSIKAVSTINAEAAAADRAEQAKRHDETLLAIARMRDGGGGGAGTGGDGTVNPLAQSIAEYRADISKVASLRGNQRAAIMAQVLAINPTFDMTQYGARAALRQNYTSGTGATGITALNTVEKHLKNLKTSYATLNNGNYPMANMVSQRWQSETGKKGAAAFNTSIEAVASEATRAFRALGGSEEDVKQWRKKLRPEMSPEQFNAAVSELEGLLQSRREEITSQLKRGGIDPSLIAPTAESLTPGPTGTAGERVINFDAKGNRIP